MRLSNVRKTPKPEIKRLNVGLLNDVIGGGLAQASVTLLGGSTGVGKTTLLMQLADSLLSVHTEKDDTVLFAQNDVPSEELLDVSKRVGAEHIDRIELLSDFSDLNETLDALLGKVNETLPLVALVDCALDRVVLHGDTVVRRCLDVARKVGTTFVIAYTWDSEGKNKTFDDGGAWAASCCLAMEMDCETGMRMLYSTKNRNGPAPVEMRLMMPQGKFVRSV